MDILTWIENRRLDGAVDGDILYIGKEKFLLLDKKEPIFDEEWNLILNENEYDLAGDVDYIAFKFGDNYYYTDRLTKPDLTPLHHLGEPNLQFPLNLPVLGIHGGYDLCNGSRLYNDWCKEAKWLGITTLGICEEGTLAGVVAFQNACEKYNIKSVVGETIIIQDKAGERYSIKLYCKDKSTWSSLIKINVQLSKKKYLTEQELYNLLIDTGLICIISPEILLSTKETLYSSINGVEIYYDLDFTEWESQSKDSIWLDNLQDYLSNYIDKFPPVLIGDCYYIGKEHGQIRKTLNLIGKHNFKNQSKTQYFKTLDDHLLLGLSLFEDSEKFLSLVNKAAENTITIFNEIDFKVITGNFFLPKYTMTEEETKIASTNDDLLWYYISNGIEKKLSNKQDLQVYYDRLDEEFRVISMGGFVDYFLILADIFKWCEKQDIWTGVGRGSAAGCLISYLLDIVLIDPLKYNLLFERFLNEGRLGKSLPDIDSDVQGERRDEVKRYIEERYGHDYVVSIGTYGTFKLKNSIKDIGRAYGADLTKTNFITAGLDTEASFTQLFEIALQKPAIKEYTQTYPHIIEEIPLCLHQPKNASIHAAGVVIVPREYGTVYEQLPVRESEGLLISEWEGNYIDQAGFLKCDILGIKQLDKFAAIHNLIQLQINKSIRFNDIPLDQEKVFDFFRKGLNEDVFQLGAAGLKAYCKELQPDNIEDLIATVALYRPGPIESGAHKRYAKIKNGLEEVDYDEGVEHITKVTYGQIIYQEQIMQVFRDIGGFTLVEADELRKVIAKTGMEISKKMEILGKFIDRFIEEGSKRGVSERGCKMLWEKIEKFATYSFNRSHAACYAITGYYSQWYKVNYPLQFWTISLQYADDNDKPNRIAEIYKTSEIKISGVDINNSGLEFQSNVETNSIYWALPSVKWVGDKIVQSILEERKLNGLFFSLEEFCERMKGYSGINKRAITHLILCGGFDSLYQIDGNSSQIKDRYLILEEYYSLINAELGEELQLCKNYKEHEWVLKQKELCGLGYVNYEKVLKTTELISQLRNYKDNSEILHIDLQNEVSQQKALVAGLIVRITERNSKRGKFAQLEIIDNTDTLFITLWNESWEEFKSILKGKEGRVVFLTGNITIDNYKNQNVIHSDQKTKLIVI